MFKNKWTEKSDDVYDKKNGIAEGSAKDISLDASRGLVESKADIKKVAKINDLKENSSQGYKFKK